MKKGRTDTRASRRARRWLEHLARSRAAGDAAGYVARAARAVGVPVPTPPHLPRARGPWPARPLHGRHTLVPPLPGGAVARQLGEALAQAGAVSLVPAAHPALTTFTEVGAALDGALVVLEPPRGGDAPGGDAPGGDAAHGAGGDAPHDDAGAEADRSPWDAAFPQDPTLRVDAAALDATGLAAPGDLEALFVAGQRVARALRPGGRVLVLTRPAGEAPTPAAAAAREATLGFMRSWAKELGRRGATVNALVIAPGAEDRVAAPARFLLSDRSAFVTGQALALTSTCAMPDARATPWVPGLAGRWVLITGAAGALGRATARAVVDEGARALLLDHPGREAGLAELAQALGGTPLPLDLAAPDAPARLVEAVRDLPLEDVDGQHAAGLHGIIQCAGLTRDRTLGKMRLRAWREALEVNLEAVVATTDALLAARAPDGGPLVRDGGRVVLFSSIAGLAGNAGQTNYAAAKAGLVGYVRAQAPALAARGVTVNALAPGFIESPMTAAMPALPRAVARRLSSLGQGGEPVDVANAAAFLVHPLSHGVTGAALRVCGQHLMGA